MEYVVYRYSDPRDQTPFYIGAGRSGRELWHLNHVRSLMTGKIVRQRTTNRAKINKIIDIISGGAEPIIDILYTGSKSDAFDKEELLICEYGRVDLGTGTLLNLRNGGQRGTRQKWSEAAKQRRSVSMKGSGNTFYGRRHTEKNIERMRIMQSNRTTVFTHTEEHKQRVSARMSGSGNPMSRWYRAISPTNEVFDFMNLKGWCQTNGFSFDGARGLLKRGTAAQRGQFRGWKIEYLERPL